MTMKIYCSVCKENFAESIARFKNSSEIYHQVNVIKKLSDSQYQCVCTNCKHTWKSKSPEAEILFHQSKL